MNVKTTVKTASLFIRVQAALDHSLGLHACECRLLFGALLQVDQNEQRKALRRQIQGTDYWACGRREKEADKAAGPVRGKIVQG